MSAARAACICGERGVNFFIGACQIVVNNAVNQSVERIARAHPNGRILIVAHGGCLRALQRHLDDDVSHPIPNCSVYEIRFRDDGFLPV